MAQLLFIRMYRGNDGFAMRFGNLFPDAWNGH